MDSIKYLFIDDRVSTLLQINLPSTEVKGAPHLSRAEFKTLE